MRPNSWNALATEYAAVLSFRVVVRAISPYIAGSAPTPMPSQKVRHLSTHLYSVWVE